MLHASTKKLIDRLAEMTELNKLEWTEGENGHISYSTEGYSVSLTTDPNEVIIASKDGKELERATAGDLAEAQNEAGETYSQIVGIMTTEATRSARGTETAISSLLAGMQDPAETAESETAAEAAPEVVVDELQEDVADETTAIAAAAVETMPSADPESAEGLTEADAAADESAKPEEASIADTSEPAIGFTEDAEAASDDQPSASESAPESVSADAPLLEPSASDPVSDPETSTEPESASDVTDAVARLADEVNQREESKAEVGQEAGEKTLSETMDASAGSEPEQPAITPFLSAAPEPANEPAGNSEAASEPLVASAEAEASELQDSATIDSVIAAVEPSAPPPAYIPFGLESSATTESHDEPVLSASAEPSPPVEIEPPASVVESDSDTALEAQGQDITGEIVATPQPEATTEFATTEASQSVDQVEAEPAAAPVDEPGPSEEAEAHSLAEHVSAAYSETKSDTNSFEPANSEAASEDSAAPTTEDRSEEPIVHAEPESQSYSLSGIGAGFGLGALSAKTEASGIPTPNAEAVIKEPEKVVIDATDDILPKLEGNLNVPLAEAASAAVGSVNTDTPSTEGTEGTDSDMLKPRTRFNPWD